MDCKYCNFTAKTLDKFNQHIDTKRHSKNIELYNKYKKIIQSLLDKTLILKKSLPLEILNLNECFLL